MFLYKARKYLKYIFKSRFRHGHSIHSPFLFGLITNVIENDGAYYSYEIFKKAEKGFANSHEVVDICKLPDNYNIKRSFCKLRTISKYIDLSPVYGRLMFRLINEFSPEEVAIFGATTGLNLLYASKADSRLPIRFFDEDSFTRTIISGFIKEYEIKNVDLKTDSSRHYFYENKTVFALVNHPFSEEKSSKIVDDFMTTAKIGSVILLRGIHSSKAMGKLWNDVKVNKKIRVTLELFDMGIGISAETLQKENFVFRFKPFIPILRSLYT